VTSQWLLEKAMLDYRSPKNADKAREFVQKYTKELADLVMAEVVSLASMVASKKAWIWTSLPLFHLFLTWICLGPQFYSLCTEKVALTPGNKSHGS
jgi:hypothetical protein